ncbi:hypothetical protein [Streptomyces hokutonensis]|uniref:hypothetical protein n=1 Tax=Streptomyces hokutonensis TaxID=1306990 RepID=UPI00035FB802|nr:hypothetical protein [Streptomyces hokutonensis]
MDPEVEQVRGDSFRADWRITDLIRHARRCGAPAPGVICPDNGLVFTALQDQVRAVAPPRRGRRPLQWIQEMTTEMNPTALLLELAAQARNMSAPDALRDVLSAGHRAWCEGVADVRADIGREIAPLSDADIAERCAVVGASWEEGMTRGEAVAALAFATWDASPAAIVYTELAERAARFGVCLLGEEVL